MGKWQLKKEIRNYANKFLPSQNIILKRYEELPNGKPKKCLR